MGKPPQNMDNTNAKQMQKIISDSSSDPNILSYSGKCHLFCIFLVLYAFATVPHQTVLTSIDIIMNGYTMATWKQFPQIIHIHLCVYSSIYVCKYIYI